MAAAAMPAVAVVMPAVAAVGVVAVAAAAVEVVAVAAAVAVIVAAASVALEYFPSPLPPLLAGQVCLALHLPVL